MEQRNYHQKVEIGETLQTRINELLSHYPADKKRSALLPVLHAVQDAHDNWISVELMDKVAGMLELTPIEVYEVVSFYNMFNTRPHGIYTFEFCRTSCCALRGGEDILDYTCRKLGIREGETTPDGLFSIATVECLGACGFGPILQLGDNYHEHLTPEKIDQLIEDCRQGNINVNE